jgi:hypothetical protein
MTEPTPPDAPEPEEGRRPRRWLWWVIGAVVLLIIIAAIAGGDDETPSTTTVAGGEGTSTSPTATTAPLTTDSPSTTTPATTTAPTTVPSAEGTRENPIPVGTMSQVGDYQVTVTAFQADATQAVLDENQFNEPPPEGFVYSLIGLAMTYVGAETGTPWIDLAWSGIGASNVASTSDDCNTYPNNILDVPELFPDGAAEANICLTVQSTDLDSLVLILESAFSLEETRIFFALPR